MTKGLERLDKLLLFPYFAAREFELIKSALKEMHFRKTLPGKTLDVVASKGDKGIRLDFDYQREGRTEKASYESPDISEVIKYSDKYLDKIEMNPRSNL
jgi:hypothetical protein